MAYSQRFILIVSSILQISLAVGLTGWFGLRRGEKAIAEVSQKLHNNLTEQIQIRLFNFLAFSELANHLLINALQSKNFAQIDRSLLEKTVINNFQVLSVTGAIDTLGYASDRGDYIGAGRLEDGSFVLKIREKGDLHIYSLDRSFKRKKLLAVRYNFDPRIRPWYQAAIKNKKKVWSPIYVTFGYAQLAITLSQPIYDVDRQKVGVIASDILLKDISKFLANLKIGKTGKIFIVERSGKIVATSQSKTLPFDDDSKRHVRLLINNFDKALTQKINLKTVQRTNPILIGTGNNQRFVQISPLKDNKGLDLLLITEFSKQEFSEIYQRNLNHTFHLIIIVFFISAIVAVIVNQLVVKPILHLFELKQDRLTQLPNRAVLIEYLDKVIKKQQIFTVLVLDCDQFKRINSSFSHSVGDKLLIAVAKRLKNSLNKVNYIARLVGDEFVVVSLKSQDSKTAIELVDTIKTALSTVFLVDNKKIFLSSRMGIAIANSQYHNPEHLLRDADTAMLRAKQINGCIYQIFDEAMHRKAISLLELETDLKSAISNQELLVYYQPIIELTTGNLSGFEALIRWKHPTKGFISPVDFIPIAEETGMILDIGLWVLKEACQQLNSWQIPITISVNLSARQLEQPDFLEKIDEILKLTKVPSQYLKFELTESILTENNEVAQEILQQLKLREIGLSIDDFGTGYSCLNYLHQFPVDTLKIDRAFVNR